MEKFGFSDGVALGMISADANSARSVQIVLATRSMMYKQGTES